MADFNSSFIKHLKHREENGVKESRKVTRKKAVMYPGQKLLRKYKRKIWYSKPHRKKVQHLFRKGLINNSSTMSKEQIKFPWNEHSHFVISERNSYNSAVLPNIIHCKDFPITDIGSELSGNRNNGNSPFSSSNSCGSPPDSQILCKTEKAIATVTSDNNCQKCNMDSSEQNNNMHVECTCLEENVYCDVEMKECSVTDMNSEQSEGAKMEECSVANLNSEQSEGFEMKGCSVANLNSEQSEGVKMKGCSVANLNSEQSEGVKMKGCSVANLNSEQSEGVKMKGCSVANVNSEQSEGVKMKGCCVDDVSSEQSECCTDSEKEDTVKSLDIDGGTSGDTYIDVESLDESGEDRDTVTEAISDKVLEVCENGVVDEPVQYVGSNVKHSQPSTQINPIKWQQQFMSFLSSSTSDESKKHHHSPRRKRSRKIRQSTCPCCLGSGEHHKKKEKSDDPVRYRKSHSLQRDHRRFIRDMSQLVSLRNKVMSVCKVLFPQCIDNVFNYANPDSEDVDKCIDQMISILHHTHQQFLHNLNVKSELNQSSTGNGPKCFKSERSGNLKYDHLSSNEVLVSLWDPAETGQTYKEQSPSSDKISTNEVSHDPPILFCPETDEIKNSSEHEQPSLFTNLCLKGSGESIVYAIPVENGIAYPDQTQVLLTGDNSPNSDLLLNAPKYEGKDLKNNMRILSEADSGILNDHELSSPDQDEINTMNVSDDLEDKSCSKSEQTTNIFDLFSKCEPQIKQETVCNSSQEKPEIKTPVKTGDRNIFDSLFNMNLSPSPPKCVEKELDQLCDKEIESFYFPSEKHAAEDKTDDIYVEVYDPAIRLCKKPKICLRAFKEKISQLLRWLLPEMAFEKNVFKNTDNLEYMLDALILSNKKDLC